tara:strand:- start:7660 stop:8475 length:816 start_codon:yes stop_codon:yes gene_type:complete
MINKAVIFFDDVLIDLSNLYLNFLFLFQRKGMLKKNKQLKNLYKNKKFFIVGNAPSINNYNLNKLVNKNVIMVNRSYKHPLYKKIKPKFHIFIDPKLSNGIWPISSIDEIHKLNPKCKIILHAKWFNLPKFKRFKKNKNIYWIRRKILSNFFDNFNFDMTKQITVAGGVLEAALTIAIYLGSKNLNILGVEGNGIAHLMVNQSSHFNGKDKDYKNHKSVNFANDMISSSRSIRLWHSLAKVLKKNNVNVYNLSKEGILDVFKYKKFKIALK